MRSCPLLAVRHRRRLQPNVHMWRVLLLLLPAMLGASSAASCASSDPTITCIATPWLPQHPAFSHNQSIRWPHRPDNLRFHHFLKTSDDGEDLTVSGVVKWRVVGVNPLQEISGFKVVISEESSNRSSTLATYHVGLQPAVSNEVAIDKEDIEFRILIDNLLVFGKGYRAEVSYLPSGADGDIVTNMTVPQREDGGNCALMTGLAKYWAPQLTLKIFEGNAEVETSVRLAPPMLCIATYEIYVQTKYGKVLKSTEMRVNIHDRFANFTFGGLTREEPLIVKVIAKKSTTGQCACVSCSCLTEKSKNFVIPGLVYRISPRGNSALPSNVQEEKSERFSFLLFLSAFAILLGLVSFCYVVRKYRPHVSKRFLLKNVHTFFPANPEKRRYKILLVIAEAYGNEESYAENIANAFKDSDHCIRCDRFESLIVEQNMLQWIATTTSTSEKIVFLHASSSPNALTVYNVVTALLPPHDARICHVKLSPAAINAMPCELEYVLPRDEHLFQEAFNIKLPCPRELNDMENISSSKEELKSDIVLAVTPPNEDHAYDSGVSSMASEGSVQRSVSVEMAKENTDVEIENANCKRAKGVETRPLLATAV